MSKEEKDAMGSVAEVRQLVEDYVQPVVREIEEPGTGLKLLAAVSKAGVNVIHADAWDEVREGPRARRGVARFTSIDSLIDHTKRFADADSVLYAVDDRSAPSISAILDYYVAGANGAPRWGRHRGHYSFVLSDEWKIWNKANASWFGMAEFQHFLEDRLPDVLTLIGGEDELSEAGQVYVNALKTDVATQQQLFELSRGLDVHSDETVKQHAKLTSGEAQIVFSTEHKTSDGKPLRVPGVFLIGIPVFKNGPVYRIIARLRYRVKEGEIKFQYELWAADRSFDDAFQQACARVVAETELPIFFGQPE
jgi:hypothetical protein